MVLHRDQSRAAGGRKMLDTTAAMLTPEIGEDATVTVVRVSLEAGNAHVDSGEQVRLNKCIQARDNVGVRFKVAPISGETCSVASCFVSKGLGIPGERCMDVINPS